MKKFTKALSLLLTVIIGLSVFVVVPSAISEKSSAKEILNYYESCIDKTSKKSVIKAEHIDYEKIIDADYSELSKRDAEETKKRDSAVLNKWTADDSWGFSFYSKTEIKPSFSIRQYIDCGEEDLVSATYSKAKNGDFTIIIVTRTAGTDFASEVFKYKTKFNKDGYLKYFEWTSDYVYTDIRGSVYGDEYWVDVCIGMGEKITYEKTPAKSISVSQTEVTLGYNECVELDVIVGPETATFKEFYFDYEYGYDYDDYYFYDDVAWAYYEDDSMTGPVTVVGESEGTVDIVFTTVDGKHSAVCTVTVEFSFLDRIHYFFDTIIETITMFFYF